MQQVLNNTHQRIVRQPMEACDDKIPRFRESRASMYLLGWEAT